MQEWWTQELNQLLCKYAKDFDNDFESIAQRLRLEICHGKWTTSIPVDKLDTQACLAQWTFLQNSDSSIVVVEQCNDTNIRASSSISTDEMLSNSESSLLLLPNPTLELKMSETDVDELLNSLESSIEEPSSDMAFVLSYLDNPPDVLHLSQDSVLQVQKVSDEMKGQVAEQIAAKKFVEETLAPPVVLPPPAPKPLALSFTTNTTVPVAALPPAPKTQSPVVVASTAIQSNVKDKLLENTQEEEDEDSEDDIWVDNRESMKAKRLDLIPSQAVVASTNSISSTKKTNRSDSSISEQRHREKLKACKKEMEELESHGCEEEVEIKSAERERQNADCATLLNNTCENEAWKYVEDRILERQERKDKLRVEQALKRQEAAAITASSKRIVEAVGSNLSNLDAVQQHSSSVESLATRVASAPNVTLKTTPEPKKVKELTPEEREANRRKLIERSILSSAKKTDDGGELLFHRDVSFRPPIATLPLDLWSTYFPYPEIGVEGNDLKDITATKRTVAVLKVADVLLEDALAELIAFFAACINTSSSEKNSLLQDFKSIGMLHTVENSGTSSKKAFPSLLPPCQNVDGAARVLYIALESVKPDESQTEFALRIQRFLKEASLSDLFSTNVVESIERLALLSSNGETTQLQDILEIVTHVSVKSSDTTALSSSDKSSFTHPLNLFTRIPAFQTFSCNSRFCKQEQEEINNKSYDIPFVSQAISICPEITVCMLNPNFSQSALTELLKQSFIAGLDLVGLKLVYVSENATIEQPCTEGALSPRIVLAFRGNNAVHTLNDDVLGPANVSLAKVLDPDSIRARFDCDVGETPRGFQAATRALTCWFGGRVLPASLSNSSMLPRPRPCYNIVPHRQSITAVLLPPVLPSAYVGIFVQKLLEKGFSISAMKRVSSSSVKTLTGSLSSSKPCILCVVTRENAIKHLALVLPGILKDVEALSNVSLVSGTQQISTATICQEAWLSEAMMLPSYTVTSQQLKKITSIRNEFHHEREETCVAIITREAFESSNDAHTHHYLLSLPSVGEILVGILKGVQLMGLKYVAAPSTELCQSFRTSQKDISGPVLVCVLRGVSIQPHLRHCLATEDYAKTGLALVTKPLQVFRTIAHTFFDHEIDYDDFSASPQRLLFEPRPKNIVGMLFENKKDNAITSSAAYVIVKPSSHNSIMKRTISVLKRANRAEMRCTGLCMVKLDRETVSRLLVQNDNAIEKNEIMDQMTSDVSIVLSFRGENAILRLQGILGPVDPVVAKSDSEFSLRASYGTSIVHNAFYGSSSYASMLLETHVLQSSFILDTTPIPEHKKKSLKRARLTLNESVCVRIGSNLVSGGSLPAILERLVSEKFEITNMKMMQASPKELSLTLDWSLEELRALRKGGWVVIAVQKDNCTTRMKTLLGKTTTNSNHPPMFRNPGMQAPPLREQYEEIYSSSSSSLAELELTTFFDQLHNSKDEIISSSLEESP